MNETSILLLLGGLDLSICVADVPFSVLNIVLIGRTPLVHFNLKCILLFQSGCVLLRALVRIVICATKFGTGNPTAAESIWPWHNLYSLSVSNRNFVVQILIVERIVATFRVRTYERKKNSKFTVGWIVLTLVSTTLVAVYGSGGQYGITEMNLTVVSVQVCLVLAEIAVFKWLFAHNKRAFFQRLECRIHSLSERYQVLQNIRIGHQLAPTMFLHLVCVSVTELANFWSVLGWPAYAFVSSCGAVTNSAAGLAIEVSLIWCHPSLKRDFGALLTQIWCCPRGTPTVHPQLTVTTAEHPQNAGERELYFAMLKQCWEGRQK